MGFGLSVARRADPTAEQLSVREHVPEPVLNVVDELGVSVDESPKSRYRSAYRFVRSVADRVLAGILLIPCLPLVAAIAAIVRIDSPGPALFRQRRIGKDGKSFTILKFRTLRAEAPTSSLKISHEDPHITRVGGFLRRTGLDELPQLWNVVRGDMALIGPRPEQVDLIHLYEPWQLKRHSVRPGITGWWQIHHRDGVPLHHHVDQDLYYIQHQGPWIDLLILLGTFRVVATALSQALGANPKQGASIGFVEVVSSEGETS